MKQIEQRGEAWRPAKLGALATIAAAVLFGLSAGLAQAADSGSSPSLDFNGLNQTGSLGTLKRGDNGWAYAEYEYWNRVDGRHDGIIQQSGLTGVNKPDRDLQLGKRIEGLATNSQARFSNAYSFSLAESSTIKVVLGIDRNWDDSKNWHPDYGKGAMYSFIGDENGNQLVMKLNGQNLEFSTALSSGSDSLALEFANLPKGDYVIEISGIVGWIPNRIPGHSDVHMGYNLDINASDVPLPGALILLGTALAGAGAAARRRAGRAPAHS